MTLMRLSDLGRTRRRHADALLADIPELTVLVGSFKQRVQRPAVRQQEYYAGKKKAHTVKVQVAVDPETDTSADVSESVPGPTADSTLLARSGLCKRVPPEGGIGGDKGYSASTNCMGAARRRAASRVIRSSRRRIKPTTGPSRGSASWSGTASAGCAATNA